MDLEFEKAPVQGSLGDCWLIAVLHVLFATRIDILKNLVRALPCGRVGVRLIPGEYWVWPTFIAHSAQPLWAAAIEKGDCLASRRLPKVKYEPHQFCLSVTFKKL